MAIDINDPKYQSGAYKALQAAVTAVRVGVDPQRVKAKLLSEYGTEFSEDDINKFLGLDTKQDTTPQQTSGQVPMREDLIAARIAAKKEFKATEDMPVSVAHSEESGSESEEEEKSDNPAVVISKKLEAQYRNMQKAGYPDPEGAIKAAMRRDQIDEALIGPAYNQLFGTPMTKNSETTHNPANPPPPPPKRPQFKSSLAKNNSALKTQSDQLAQDAQAADAAKLAQAKEEVQAQNASQVKDRNSSGSSSGTVTVTADQMASLTKDIPYTDRAKVDDEKLRNYKDMQNKGSAKEQILMQMVIDSKNAMTRKQADALYNSLFPPVQGRLARLKNLFTRAITWQTGQVQDISDNEPASGAPITSTEETPETSAAKQQAADLAKEAVGAKSSLNKTLPQRATAAGKPAVQPQPAAQKKPSGTFKFKLRSDSDASTQSSGSETGEQGSVADKKEALKDILQRKVSEDTVTSDEGPATEATDTHMEAILGKEKLGKGTEVAKASSKGKKTAFQIHKEHMLSVFGKKTNISEVGYDANYFAEVPDNRWFGSFMAPVDEIVYKQKETSLSVVRDTPIADGVYKSEIISTDAKLGFEIMLNNANETAKRLGGGTFTIDGLTDANLAANFLNAYTVVTEKDDNAKSPFKVKIKFTEQSAAVLTALLQSEDGKLRLSTLTKANKLTDERKNKLFKACGLPPALASNVKPVVPPAGGSPSVKP